MKHTAGHILRTLGTDPWSFQGATLSQVIWSSGATASGSSGSPLIDVESQKVVGVLTGGFASCQDRTGPDYYGRLSAVRLPSHVFASHVCFMLQW